MNYSQMREQQEFRSFAAPTRSNWMAAFAAMTVR
jgi:hypothetical protein